ncbi:hypothetical protein FB567DRAFT_530383 [Paraphoma chrysanthemicola]|uniref:Uncharacterized protein n=1 Tax=Paraphoma chrysanthemicola TaxID=798071 RepID=A0A8K0VXN7_9PLEO|nr:hypothetical protein FB567DRAFT_530383 [Paraphoma chrysanthemicola]
MRSTPTSRASCCFISVVLVMTVVNFLTSTLVPGYMTLGRQMNSPDADGTGASQRFDIWAKTHVGDAKSKAVGNECYKKA